MKRGARSFQLKPLKNEALSVLFKDIFDFNEKTTRQLLVVEDNEIDAELYQQVIAFSKKYKINLVMSNLFYTFVKY